MSDRLRLARCLMLAVLVSLLATTGAQAQSGRSYRGDDGPPARGRQDRPPSRQ